MAKIIIPIQAMLFYTTNNRRKENRNIMTKLHQEQKNTSETENIFYFLNENNLPVTLIDVINLKSSNFTYNTEWLYHNFNVKLPKTPLVSIYWSTIDGLNEKLRDPDNTIQILDIIQHKGAEYKTVYYIQLSK